MMVERFLAGLDLEPSVGERRHISVVLDSVGAIGVPLSVDLVVGSSVMELDEPHRVERTRSVPAWVRSR